MRWHFIGAAAALALGASGLTGLAQTAVSADALTLYPASMTLGARDRAAAMVAARSGKIPAHVTWSISDPGVASIAPHGPSVDITALSPGRALVTASANGRIATASITVAEGDRLRFGTTRWSVPRTAGLVPRPLLDAARVDEAGADFFAIDADPMKRFAVVRALTARGTLVWQRTVRGTPWAGGPFGGLLVRLGALDEPSRTLARLDAPRSAVPEWRFRAPGDIGDFGAADDGTIFLAIHPRPSGARDKAGQVVTLDGRTGVETGRYSLPPSTWQTVGSCVPKSASVRRPSDLGSLGAGSNGGIYAELLIVHDTWTRACERGRPVPGRGRFAVSRELRLVRFTRKGIATVRTLWRSEAEGPDTVERLRALDDVAPGPVVELKSGQLVALWTRVNTDANGRLSGRLTLTRLAGGEVATEVVRPGVVAQTNRPWRVLFDAPDTTRVYVADGSTLQAINLDAGTTIWTMDTAALPFEAVETNTVVAADPVRNQVMEINYRGTVLLTFPARVVDPRTVAGGPAALHGADSQSHAIVEVQQRPYVESGWSTMLDIDTSFAEVRRRFAGFLVETK